MKPLFNLSIGDLSGEAKVEIETIRYYERIGLIPRLPRTSGGHRFYAKEHKQRLVFIRRARELGFSIKQVRLLLGLAGGQRMTCAKVKSVTEQHIAEIRERLKDLKQLERVLTGMAAQCRGDESPD